MPHNDVKHSLTLSIEHLLLSQGWGEVEGNIEEMVAILLIVTKSVTIKSKSSEIPPLQLWHLKLWEHYMMACIQKDINPHTFKKSVKALNDVWHPILQCLYQQNEIPKDPYDSYV